MFSIVVGMGNLVMDGYNVFVGVDFIYKGCSMVGDKMDEDIYVVDY